MTIYTDNKGLLEKFPGFYRPLSEAYNDVPSTKHQKETKGLETEIIGPIISEGFLKDLGF